MASVTWLQAQVTDSLLNLTIPIEERIVLLLSRIEPLGYQASVAFQYKKQTVFIPKTPLAPILWDKIQPYFRAITFLDAQEERKLSLTNPVKSFYKLTPTYTHHFTLHNLLTHTAGLHRIDKPLPIDSLWWWIQQDKEPHYSAYHDTLADFIFEKMTGMTPLQWFKTKTLSKTGTTTTESGLDIMAFLQIEDLLRNNKILQPMSLNLLTQAYQIKQGQGISYAWKLSETIRQTPIAYQEDSSFSLRLYPMEGLRLAISGKNAPILADILARYLTDGLPHLPPKVQNLMPHALDTLAGIWEGNGYLFQMTSAQNQVHIQGLNAKSVALVTGKKMDKNLVLLQQMFPYTDSLTQHYSFTPPFHLPTDSIIWLEKRNQTYIFIKKTDKQMFEADINLEKKTIDRLSMTSILPQQMLPTSVQSLEAWIYPEFPLFKFSKNTRGWLLELRQEKVMLQKKNP